MASEHITLAEVLKIVLSIAPLAPTSIVDAISGYVTLLTNYSPLTPEDDVVSVAFTICMRFLDDCYNGASPRDVFEEIITSMSADLLQPFPDYRSVYDSITRGELIKELSFRWQLYINISHHTQCRRPEMTVSELQDYFQDLDECNISNSSEDTTLPSEDSSEVCQSQEDLSVNVGLPAPVESEEPSAVTMDPKIISFEYFPTPSPIQTNAVCDDYRVSTISHRSNGSHSATIQPHGRPLSEYRVFFASWKNGYRDRSSTRDEIRRLSPVKLLLFTGRKPKWKRLSNYDITIPWRWKCDN